MPRGDEDATRAKPRRASVPRAEARPPSRVGAYEVRREIGRGGMGVVYEAHDPRLDRPVALKSLPLTEDLDDEAREQLHREARALAAVNHPNVAIIHGLEEQDGRHWLVLELVDGETLAERLSLGPLAPADAMMTCAQVAAGMAAAHESGVVHGDLKPGNVMITRRGIAKVLDFGLARRSARGKDAAAGAGPACGTPGYMSPEQVASGVIDERSDAWSFGCVLLECLTGRPAVPGDSGVSRIAATMRGETDVASIPDGVAPDLRDLVARCLEADASRRLADLGEARRVLDELIARDAPLARSSPRTGGNLPAPVTSFVGRERDLAALSELLGRERLVTLTGTAGSGKTRLALHVASALQARFTHGAWLVELASVTSAPAIPRQVASSLGVRLAAPDDPMQALAAHLASRETLIVLDNCEHLREGCAALARALLALPRVRILATSREALGVPGEHALALAPLEPPSETDADPAALGGNDAVRLFIERARAVAPSFALTPGNASLVASACRQLDGIPLAIELAAARLRHVGMEQLHERLGDRFRLLRGRDSGRHGTLRTAIDWSHDLLSPAEQAVFRRLGVFLGGFTLEAAERVASAGGIEPEDVLDSLSALVDKSLVMLEDSPSGARYRMLESIREHAREKLETSHEEPAARARHGEAMLALLSEGGMNGGMAEPAWMRRVAADHANLHEALAHCARDARGDERHARLVAAAWPYWNGRGLLAEAIGWIESALARSSSAPEDVVAELRTALAVLLARAGELARAKSLAEEDLALRRSAGDERGESLALRNLGRIALDQGAIEDAHAHLSRALEISRRLDDRRSMASAVRILGLVASAQNDRARERDLYEESLALSIGLDDRMGITQSRNNLALMMREDGDLAGARSQLEGCLAMAAESAMVEMTAVAHNNLGFVASDEGRWSDARAHVSRALRLRCEIGDHRYLPNSLVAMAAVDVGEGDAHRAAWLLGAAEGLASRLGFAIDVRDDHAGATSRVRAALGEDAYERAAAAGRVASLPRVIDLALGAS